MKLNVTSKYIFSRERQKCKKFECYLGNFNFLFKHWAFRVQLDSYDNLI